MLFRSDRKSTRLNSSHTLISYAVFCLKKKKRHLSRRRGWRCGEFERCYRNTRGRGGGGSGRCSSFTLITRIWGLLVFFFFFLKEPAPPEFSPFPLPAPFPF